MLVYNMAKYVVIWDIVVICTRYLLYISYIEVEDNM